MVPELEQITVIENEYRLPTGRPGLGEAYTMLKARWQAGRRDLETGLRLMFLAWYACAEPPSLTGLPTEENPGEVFQEVFHHFGGTSSNEPEFLYAAGLMCELCSWCPGAEAEWLAVAQECMNAARRLRPEGYPPEHFQGRGTYGDYFAHAARAGKG
jgi:hypothetical protein